MKKISLFAGMLALLLLVVSSQQAHAFFFAYTAGFQVQNLSASTANIVITFYNNNTAGGAVVASPSDTIPANGSKTYFPLTAVSAGFNGSAVISSDQQVAAVVNVLGNSGAAGAAYIGFSSGATTLQIPLLMKGNFGFNTWFKVQNAGSATATVNVAYSDGTTASASVQPGASATFDQSTETHSATVFAASVTSAQPIVASVVEESSSVMFAYNGFTAGSTNPVMPLINANNYGYVTGAQIQNGGASATTVTVSYSHSLAGTDCTETQTIPAGQSKTFALFAFSVSPQTPGSTCAFGATFVGSGKVTGNTASMPLSVIVNQLNGSVNGEAYDGFDSNAATAKVVLPLIMDRNFNFNTGISIMNVGAATTTINCTFTGNSFTLNQSVAPNAALTNVQTGELAAGYVGSGTCTAGAGGKIVGIVNELNGVDPGDHLLVYEGISN